MTEVIPRYDSAEVSTVFVLSPLCAAPGQDQVSDWLHAEYGAEEEAAGGESGRSDRGARQTARSGSVQDKHPPNIHKVV